MSSTTAFTSTLLSPKNLSALKHEVSSKSQALKNLFAIPDATELRACWELCRLQNGMGCATVFLPVAWSIAMAYHADSSITGLDAILKAVTYFFMCIGIKCLVSFWPFESEHALTLACRS